MAIINTIVISRSDMKDINIGATKMAYVCPQCKGSGQVGEPQVDHTRSSTIISNSCPKCKGFGYTPTESGDSLIKFIELFMEPLSVGLVSKMRRKTRIY